MHVLTSVIIQYSKSWTRFRAHGQTAENLSVDDNEYDRMKKGTRSDCESFRT
jgi:hypothetical protein